MILGMNPRELRKRRSWVVYIWYQEQHWSLVLRPDGEPFQARVVDDFVHNALHCYSAEVSSMRLFLIYEVLVDSGTPYLMLSTKTDFVSELEVMQPLGVCGPASFEDLERYALGVAKGLQPHSFSWIDCDSRLFATEFAVSLGAPRLDPALTDSDVSVRKTSDATVAVGAAGAIVALTSAATVAAQPSLTSALASFALQGMAAGATGLTLICTLSAVGGVAGSRTLYNAFCQQPEMHLLQGALLPHSVKGVRSAKKGGMWAFHGASNVVGSLPRQPRSLANEPEAEAEPACYKEPPSEGLQRSIEHEASMLGGSRVAPWSTAPSWEQPPWADMPEAGSSSQL